jgi:hypothetical protein
MQAKTTNFKPTPGSSGVVLGSLGTLIFALLQQQWELAIAVGTTIVPGALAYVVANGGVRGVVRKFWGDDEQDPPAAPAGTRQSVTTEPSPATA